MIVGTVHRRRFTGLTGKWAGDLLEEELLALVVMLMVVAVALRVLLTSPVPLRTCTASGL
jgi:hypothetical protein